jgi:hypothetical protein
LTGKLESQIKRRDLVPGEKVRKQIKKKKNNNNKKSGRKSTISKPGQFSWLLVA